MALTSSFSYAIVSADAFSLIVCVILLYCNRFETPRGMVRTRRRVIFSTILVVNIVGLWADLISWLLDGNASMIPVLYVANALSFSVTFALMAFFSAYLWEYIFERQRVSQVPFAAICVYSAVCFLLTLVASFCGWIFVFENGVCGNGAFYDLYLLLSFLSLVFGFAIIFAQARKLGVHDAVASLLYVLIPGLSTAISLFIPEWSFAYAAATVSLLAIYVMIQSDQASLLEQEGRVSLYNATHDQLTGLYNRRAYTDKFDETVQGEGEVGVVFSDVNGLKYANDNKGHEAGDALLVAYSDLLMMHFRKNDIFRISGDEFVIIVPGASKHEFERRVSGLENALAAQGVPMASCGSDHGEAESIGALLRSAESKMYEQKALFHEQHPEYSH